MGPCVRRDDVLIESLFYHDVISIVASALHPISD